MRRRSGPALLTLVLGVLAAAVLLVTLAPDGGRAADGPAAVAEGRDRSLRAVGPDAVARVVITWRPGAGSRAARAGRLAGRSPGTRPAARMTATTEAYWLDQPLAGAALDRELRRLRATPGVARVEPDVLGRFVLIPDDPEYGTAQWNLDGPFGIQAPDAWDLTTGGPAAVVAVLDSGIRLHPELTGRVLPGYDFVSSAVVGADGNGLDADPADPGDAVTAAESTTPGSPYFGCPVTASSWHGTKVAGIALARGNNGAGIAGVAWGSRLLPVRVGGKCGLYLSDAANAIRWAAGGSVAGVPANATPSRILTLAFEFLSPCATFLQAAIDDAASRGAVLLAAAGNRDAPAAGSAPANCANTIAVAATDADGRRWSDGNHGPVVDVSAPGDAIRTTSNAGTGAPGSPSYATVQGTSASVAHAAGIGALLLTADPSLTRAQLASRLRTQAGPFGPDGAPDSCQALGCGSGILSADAALDSLGPRVLSFGLDAASDTGASASDRITRAATLVFDLAFDRPVTGVSSADLSNKGTATGCAFSVSGAGAAYEISAASCSGGTVTPRFAAGGASGGGVAGPVNARLAAAVTVDRVRPAVTRFRTATSSPSNDTSFDYDLTFSEPIVLGTNAFSNSGSAACTLTPSGTAGSALTLTADGCGTTGVVEPRLGVGKVSDVAGNTAPVTAVGPTFASGTPQRIQLDFAAPDVASFSTSVASPTNLTSISYTLTFGEAISGLGTADLSNAGTATGCALAPSASAGTVITVTVTGCSASGTLRPRLDEGAVVDAAGNDGPAADRAASTTLTLDRTPPSVSAFTTAVGSPTNATSIAWTVTFDEAVSGIGAGDFGNAGTATGCDFSPSGAGGTEVTLTVTGCSATGTLRPRLLAGSVTDAVGTSGPTANAPADTTLTLDRVRPGVSSLVLLPGSDSGVSDIDRLTRAADLDLRLTFDEAVTGLALGDLTIGGSATGCQAEDLTGSGTTRTVTLVDCSEGTVAVTIAAGSATDAAGNTGPASAFTAETITIDRSAPTGLTLSRVSPSPTTSTALVFRLTGSEDLACVTLDGDDLTVTDGVLGAITNAGDACDIAVTSTVAPGTIGPTSLSASASFSVADRAGNPATDASGTPSITVDRSAIDVTPPTVSGVDLDPGQAAPGAQVQVSAALTDDRAVATAQVRVAGGRWTTAPAADGAYGGASEGLAATIVPPFGRSVAVCVRATDPTGNRSAPVCATLTITDVIDVGAGDRFTCIVLDDGRVRCAGSGDQGQLGSGDREGSSLPVLVRVGPGEPLTGVTQLAVGRAHACARRDDGSVACWGDGAGGRLGDGATADNLFAALIPGLTGVSAVTAGGEHTCARLSDTTVRCWGRNTRGQLGDGTTTDRTTPVAVPLAGVTSVAAGGAHTCARLGSGAVRCWGRNSDGQLGDGTLVNRPSPVAVPGLGGVAAVAAGSAHTCARLGSGLLRCWGDNARGQVGDGSLTDRTAPQGVAGLTGASVTALGGRHSCAIRGAGVLRCWGDNAAAQLGDGTRTTRRTPVAVQGLTGASVLGVSGGASHTCARLVGGAVVCWGDNTTGGLGIGNTQARLRPKG